MRRRDFTSFCALPLLTHAQAKPDLRWHDARQLRVEGQGWSDTASPYDRLPARAESLVRREVWDLSRYSSGIAVRFVTDATTLHARWRLRREQLSMPNTAGMAHSGLDLYVRPSPGSWRWLGFAPPTKFPDNESPLVGAIPAASREYLLYLPLFNAVERLEIGIPAGSRIAPAPARQRKPILFYGTSITHGAGASRAGMTHASILGRRFDREVINLGFSGNGRMEIEIARLLTELDPAVYVIDCLPNIVAAQVRERTRPLVEELRRARPTTPIVLVEDRNYQDAFLVETKRKRNEQSQAALREVFAGFKKQGLKNISYLPAAGLLGRDGEATIDSSHPTDLGYVRQADAFERVLRRILKPAV
ncbi:MAG: SGNH/GDSL hydrolase family protein [Bryobacter sp.]|jgi:hypothetical protein|nr:SGNH/GDSL hydrolase family protein [Bryobacter sp. CoA8 C33]